MSNHHNSKQTNQHTTSTSKSSKQDWEPLGFSGLAEPTQMRKAHGVTGEGVLKHVEAQRGVIQNKGIQRSSDQSSKPNNTGLPDKLKAGVEGLSGLSMDDVNVHYNSPKPRELGALAYAQGTDIHMGPGQEKHLPHEAWHVVQQKQGRVIPTVQRKGAEVNDDVGLEKEADIMGGLANTDKARSNTVSRRESSAIGVVQCKQDALKSVDQPSAGKGKKDQSTKVPDLTRELTDEIEKANDKSSRQKALDNLKLYLEKQSAVVDTDLGNTQRPIKVQYKHTSGGELATTIVDVGNKSRISVNDGVLIEVYKGAFEQGPAVLYSVFRHELIHAAQRMNSADDEKTGTDGSDGYIYSDIEEPLNNSDKVNGGRTKNIKEKIKLPLQEIETHCWEIAHAQETGVGFKYISETVNYLVDYIHKLADYVCDLAGEMSRDKVAGRLLKYWEGYLKKSLNTLMDTWGHMDECGQNFLSEKENDTVKESISDSYDELLEALSEAEIN